MYRLSVQYVFIDDDEVFGIVRRSSVWLSAQRYRTGRSSPRSSLSRSRTENASEAVSSWEI